MAWGDPQPNLPAWMPRSPAEPLQLGAQPDSALTEQWIFQYQQNLLLTVQAIYRLQEALASKML